ncbi:hypothetical protein [Mycobacterium sp. 1274756.6]|uniref:hypothetical protein n=1 Tax=Mycobacterium sp. 1274756.6 TaxID=1834076 RepID=UPI000801D410|nr:hypothetical protein [Mycobacterium sp. 1274756.6]OBJ71668.1 hypothetical protein A5643_07280 [Mycobacterium sp. 1274756.6]
MNATTRIGLGCAAALLAAVTAPAALADPTETEPPTEPELHNITYTARIDGVAPGGQATFRTQDGQTNEAPLSALPGREFEAQTVLADPADAALQVRLQWPYSANVFCQITVDDVVAVQRTEFVTTAPGADDPDAGTLSCAGPAQPPAEPQQSQPEPSAQDHARR